MTLYLAPLVRIALVANRVVPHVLWVITVPAPYQLLVFLVKWGATQLAVNQAVLCVRQALSVHSRHPTLKYLVVTAHTQQGGLRTVRFVLLGLLAIRLAV